MKKRHIKSVAHWAIMSILLLFPVLMVGISAFAHDETVVNENYQYSTNDVETVEDLVVGNIYQITGDTDVANGYIVSASMILVQTDNSYVYTVNTQEYDDAFLWLQKRDEGYVITLHRIIADTSSWLNYPDQFTDYQKIYFVYYGTYREYLLPISNVSSSDYLGEHYVNVQNASYKQEVNNWANGFKNLPVNQWYGDLLNTIGVGQTDNSVMNVIYVYPLYVLWIYILDLILDCLLLIINFGHDALHRLGADNE